MNYDTMEAGEEMDQEIAFKVMGWDAVEWINARYFMPSRKIEFAWQVVDQMLANGRALRLSAPSTTAPRCMAGFSTNDGMVKMMWGDTAPLSICRAALRAVQP